MKKIFLLLTEKLFFLQTVIILSLVYFFILGPVAILAKIFSKDFLRTKTRSKSFWQGRRTVTATIENAKKLY